MSCNCKFNKNVAKYKTKFQTDNNYCTYRTINEPRDTYNMDIQGYWSLQDKFVHHNARGKIDQMNGFQGCLGCASDKPVCPTVSGIAYPDHVGVDSKLRGL